MPPMTWFRVPLARGGVPSASFECCCVGHDTCGCTNMPDTLYVCNADDDSLLFAMEWINPLPSEDTEGWHNPDWSVEFFCVNGSPDYWDFDDSEGGTVHYNVDACTGTIAEYEGVSLEGPLSPSDSYDIYISTTPCTG